VTRVRNDAGITTLRYQERNSHSRRPLVNIGLADLPDQPQRPARVAS
jgi:hypothetical protein